MKYPVVTKIHFITDRDVELEISPSIFEKGSVITTDYRDGQEFLVDNLIDGIYHLSLVALKDVKISTAINVGSEFKLVRSPNTYWSTVYNKG